jgi:enamine deaminase RidA (YjgF/YER057c/UK114 family)
MRIEELITTSGAAVTIAKSRISNPQVLNEADQCPIPSSFSRSLRVEVGDVVVLLISGTASIDDPGRSVHVGDFRAQVRPTFDNITGLLTGEGAPWKDIVRTTCYLRDIERDYEAFNEERSRFYNEQGLDPLPASTGIQAILCRPELPVEIEAITLFIKKSAKDE